MDRLHTARNCLDDRIKYFMRVFFALNYRESTLSPRIMYDFVCSDNIINIQLYSQKLQLPARRLNNVLSSGSGYISRLS